jgi:hypothetical protein
MALKVGDAVTLPRKASKILRGTIREITGDAAAVVVVNPDTGKDVLFIVPLRDLEPDVGASGA